ncbi:hypothetical protein [Desulfovirgula thermocuniculi]|uniref:hypothetical protein n=1 Tax=Desulfovirgula thermocuniculi TaxID=348842 RepID=UPI000405C05A|nr:hypothetical protein [Desulfovirgula thermocuniculi]
MPKRAGKIGKLLAWLAAAAVLQAGVYLYLDRVLLAPASPFQVGAVTGKEDIVTTGKVYYSRDRRYMAHVKNDQVEIYSMKDKKLVRTVDLEEKRVSYFKWLEDRDLALMGLYHDGAAQTEVTLTQLFPEPGIHEVATTIKELPKGSRITDVAYSVATNVIYIQVKTASNIYRIYRTDANHNLARIYLNTNNIGRIAVLFDQDTLIYDDLTHNTVNMREGNGRWRVISPPNGRYRLVGVDHDNNIYIAKLNEEGLSESIYRGRLQVGFFHQRDLRAPVDARELTLSDVMG